MPVAEEVVVDDETAMAHHYRSSPARGRCLLVPPFHLPALELEPVAEGLVGEGFDVVSLDPRNNGGLGSGEMTEFRMSTLVADCRAAIQKFQPTCVVAVSLGARAALRALATTPGCDSAVFLTPVVDLHATLRAVLGRDWFAVAHDAVPARVPVLGTDINAPRFLRDCEQQDLVTLVDTGEDLMKYSGRLTLLPGTADPWVDLKSVRRLVAVLNRTGNPITVREVDCDRHMFHEDPDLAIRLVAAMIEEVRAIHDTESKAS